MSQKSTNYQNTFITIAPDYIFDHAKPPKDKTIGAIQLDLILQNPYGMTSDELLFETHAIKNQIDISNPLAKAEFFEKSLACLRCSPLVKTLGYGVHHDENCKIAAFPIESDEYKRLLQDDNIKKTHGMRSKRA